MKKFLIIIAVIIVSFSESYGQLNMLKKAINNKKEEPKREISIPKAKEPEKPKPFYSPEEKAKILKQIREAKKVEDLPLITTVVYYPSIEVTKLVTTYNEITDKKEVKWNKEDKLETGDTITIYGTYNLGEFTYDHVPSVSDLSPVPYKNRFARITPNHDENAQFIHSRSVEKCLDYWGDEGIWYTYEGRKDTILLREQYLKENAAGN